MKKEQKHTKKSIKKMSDSHKEWHKQNVHPRGSLGKHWKLSSNAKKSIGEKNRKSIKLAWQDPIKRQNMLKNRPSSNGENNNFYGKYHTKEYKKNKSNIMKEKWNDRNYRKLQMFKIILIILIIFMFLPTLVLSSTSFFDTDDFFIMGSPNVVMGGTGGGYGGETKNISEVPTNKTISHGFSIAGNFLFLILSIALAIIIVFIIVFMLVKKRKQENHKLPIIYNIPIKISKPKEMTSSHTLKGGVSNEP
jgi:hypothetical protein